MVMLWDWRVRIAFLGKRYVDSLGRERGGVVGRERARGRGRMKREKMERGVCIVRDFLAIEELLKGRW